MFLASFFSLLAPFFLLGQNKYTISFVGLIVPHIVRLLIGPDHRYLIPASAMAGAMLLIVADAFARVVVAPAELPAGILTALLGTPFFFSLLAQKRKFEEG